MVFPTPVPFDCNCCSRCFKMNSLIRSVLGMQTTEGHLCTNAMWITELCPIRSSAIRWTKSMTRRATKLMWPLRRRYKGCNMWCTFFQSNVLPGDNTFPSLPPLMEFSCLTWVIGCGRRRHDVVRVIEGGSCKRVSRTLSLYGLEINQGLLMGW